MLGERFGERVGPILQWGGQMPWNVVRDGSETMRESKGEVANAVSAFPDAPPFDHSEQVALVSQKADALDVLLALRLATGDPAIADPPSPEENLAVLQVTEELRGPRQLTSLTVVVDGMRDLIARTHL